MRHARKIITNLINSLILISMIASPVFAEMDCPKTLKSSSYVDGIPVIDKEMFPHVTEPFFKTGKITCHITRGDKPGQGKRYRLEEGRINGVDYDVYYSDGSGSVQGTKTKALSPSYEIFGSTTRWTFSCEIDEMDDKVSCHLSRGDMVFIFYSPENISIFVGGGHYPGSYMYIRVDKNKSISARENGVFSITQKDELFKQMSSGLNVLTRYTTWPSRNQKISRFTTFGFQETLTVVTAVWKSLSASSSAGNPLPGTGLFEWY